MHQKTPQADTPRIASAVFHLGDHVQKNRRMGGSLSEDAMNKICETIEQLNILFLGASIHVKWEKFHLNSHTALPTNHRRFDSFGRIHA